MNKFKKLIQLTKNKFQNTSSCLKDTQNDILSEATLKKDDLMFVTVVGLWILTILYFNPRLLILMIGPESFIAKISVILFIICLDIFWFYAIFHMTILTFSYFLKERTQQLKPIQKQHPPVALLYVTYNDFRADAVLSCINQDYDNSHAFILDDSTDSKYINNIDKFAGKYAKKVTVIRREKREAFKAGNINHALKLIAVQYDYFAISDSDSILPPDFISKLLPYFSINKKIGFVQAMNKINPDQKSYLAKAMGFNLELHYKRYILPREKYGFVMFHGHGALIRTNVWQEVDGFPEIVSEDLGFSTRMRKNGYTGVLAENCVCYEDYPPTYRHYRRRTEKWVKGTLEFLFKEYPSFFRTKSISWFEKLDVMVSGLSLSLGFPFLLFLLLGSLALPIYFSNFRSYGPVFISAIPEGKTTVSLLTGLRYNVYWTRDFYLIMLITIFYPLIPVLVDLVKKPAKMLMYMSISTYLFLSTLIWITVQTLSYLISRKVDFLVTAHEGAAEKTSKSNLWRQIISLKKEYLLVLAVEFISAFIFIALMIRSNNLWLISVSIALFLSPFLLFFDFKSRIMRCLLSVPFIVSLFVLLLISNSIVK
ncbi:MAG: glycosyltransferase [Candidatus Omnitrophota bacterium]